MDNVLHFSLEMLCPLQMAVLLLLFKINVIFALQVSFFAFIAVPLPFPLPAQELCSHCTQWRDYVCHQLVEIKIQGFLLVEANTELPIATSW